MNKFHRRLAAVVALSLSLAGLTATAAPAATPKAKTAKVLRLGFFPNLTHSPALVAIERKSFEKDLAKQGTKVEWTAFNAGPSAIEALKGGSIDATFIGPNPAVSGFVSTRGTLLRVVAGAASGGAQFITKSSIKTVADLKGKTFATPQLGNTQDVALRAYLKSKGYSTSILGGGDVNIAPTSNSTTLDLFKKGELDGAWVPEPWASRLVLEGNGRVFLDERSLWAKKRFLTTLLVVKSDYLKSYRATVKTLVGSLSSTIDWIQKNPQPAKDAVQNQLLKWTSAKLSDDVINRAWGNFRVTLDPLAATLEKDVDDAVDAGTLTGVGSRGINGIFDLRVLNEVRSAAKLSKFSANGLGQE